MKFIANFGRRCKHLSKFNELDIIHLRYKKIQCILHILKCTMIIMGAHQ